MWLSSLGFEKDQIDPGIRFEGLPQAENTPPKMAGNSWFFPVVSCANILLIHPFDFDDFVSDSCKHLFSEIDSEALFYKVCSVID